MDLAIFKTRSEKCNGLDGRDVTVLIAEVERLMDDLKKAQAGDHDYMQCIAAVRSSRQEVEKLESDYARLLETHRESVEKNNLLQQAMEDIVGEGDQGRPGWGAYAYDTAKEAIRAIRAIPIKEETP